MRLDEWNYSISWFKFYYLYYISASWRFQSLILVFQFLNFFLAYSITAWYLRFSSYFYAVLVLNWWVSVLHMEISFCVRTLELEVLLHQNIALPLGVGAIIIKPSERQVQVIFQKNQSMQECFLTFRILLPWNQHGKLDLLISRFSIEDKFNW